MTEGLNSQWLCFLLLISNFSFSLCPYVLKSKDFGSSIYFFLIKCILEGINLLKPRSPEPEIGGLNTQASWMLFVGGRVEQRLTPEALMQEEADTLSERMASRRVYWAHWQHLTSCDSLSFFSVLSFLCSLLVLVRHLKRCEVLMTLCKL